MATQPASTVPQLGEMLRYWRHERGKSQLDLSLDTGISQRHLSFVESGRSVPSRDLLSIVSDALNIPLRERNVLLLASGYAPFYSELNVDAEQMAIVTRVIDRMLQQHEPHPALVLDRYWNVIRTNQAAPRFFGSFVDLESRPKPRNLLDLMFDPAVTVHAEVVLLQPDSNISNVQWQLLPEDWYKVKGEDANSVKPLPIEGLIKTEAGLTAKVITPSVEGPYRLFATIHDKFGNFSTCNIPFYVVKAQ